MVYCEGDDFSNWQCQFLEKIKSLRGPLPDRVDPSVEFVESIRESDHTRNLIRVSVSEFSTLVAYLLLPNDLSIGERRPGLIVSHGHAAYGIDAVCGLQGLNEGDNDRRAYALPAVRSGYVVMVPAWWGWTGRDGYLDLVGRRDRCNTIQMAAAMYEMNVTDLHIQRWAGCSGCLNHIAGSRF